MTTPHQHGRLDASAADLAALLRNALESSIQTQSAPDGTTPTWIVGFSVEDQTVHALIPKIMDEFRNVSEEHAATIIGWEISGVMDIERGTRVWGTVELANESAIRGEKATR